MATAYYKRIYNCVVSGTQLQSYLSGEDLRALEFDANVTVTPPVSFASSTTVNLTPEQWVQSAVSSLPVINNLTSTCKIDLGVDTGSQASQYLNFFNINSGSELRVLRFLQLSSNSSKGVDIGNTTSTATNVKVTSVYGGTAAGTQILFSPTTATANLPGNETIVLVTGTPSATLSSNTVTFNVLTGPL